MRQLSQHCLCVSGEKDSLCGIEHYPFTLNRRNLLPFHRDGHGHSKAAKHIRSLRQRTTEEIAEEQAAARAVHGSDVELVNIFTRERLNHASKAAQQSPKVPKPCISHIGVPHA